MFEMFHELQQSIDSPTILEVLIEVCIREYILWDLSLIQQGFVIGLQHYIQAFAIMLGVLLIIPFNQALVGADVMIFVFLATNHI